MKITVRDPASYSVFAEMIVCGTVYPLSMTQGYQHGDIYTDGRAVLFHHDCGFAFLSGTAGEDTLEAVYSLMDNCGRRFVLFSEDDGITEFLSKKPGIHTDMRYFYEYSGAQKKVLPEGMELREIDSDIISALDGRIVPAFSWSTDRFLSRGKGFAVMCGGEAASWAFSAAVSGDEIDIGVETAGKYRGQGLACAAVAAMTEYILSTGRRPVWACHCKNTASQRLAEKTGFVKISECSVITKETV